MKADRFGKHAVRQLDEFHSGMLCPECGKRGSYVTDSRFAQKKNAIRRRRDCDTCHAKFTTYEFIKTQEEVKEEHLAVAVKNVEKALSQLRTVIEEP